ncbi:MAG: MarR family winged helix-turn-helix transcriptional regulator [Chloroflexota bacterium]
MMHDDERRSLIDEIIHIGETESLRIRPVMPEEWFRLELTMSQLKVLLWLHSHGVSRVSEVAWALGTSQAVASGVLDRLVHHELVERTGDPADRRVVLCNLSTEGKELAHKLWQSSIEQGRALLEMMTVEELRSVRDAVEMIFRVLRRVSGEAGARDSEGTAGP